MNFLKLLFSRRWLVATLLVMVGMGVMLRLSVWQMDRLQQRRAANAELVRTLESDPLVLTGDTTISDPEQLKNRRVTATGSFDFDQQLSLKVQNWQGRAGIHLIAPLVLDGETAVLVDRGWIPDAESPPENWTAYDEPGTVTIDGYAALSQTLGRTSSTNQPTEPQQAWYRVDIAAIQPQMPYRLLSIYILQAPVDEGLQDLPYRSKPTFDLSEGPHLSYAIQWVLFSLILGGGYIYYVKHSMAETEADDA